MFVKLFKYLLFYLVIIFAISNDLLGELQQEKIKLRFYTVGNAEEFKNTLNIVNQFNKISSNIKVEAINIPFGTDAVYDYFKILLETGPTEKNIDLISVDSSWAVNLSKYFLDLSKYFDKKTFNQHFSNILKNYTFKNKIFAMPWYSDVGMIYYRKDLLKKYNINIPTTWKDLTYAATEICSGEIRSENNPYIVGYIWQGYAYEGLTCNALEWIYGNAGGTIINNKKQITINNRNAIEALKMAAAWIEKTTPVSVTTMKENGAQNLFLSGNAVFLRSWPSFMKICNAKDSHLKGKVGIIPIPKGKLNKNSGVIGGWGIAILKYTNYPHEAAEFIQFMTSMQIQKYRAEVSGNLPTLKAFYENKELVKKLGFEIIHEALLQGFNRPCVQSYPHYKEVSGEFAKAVYSVINKEASPEDALKKLTKTLKNILHPKRTNVIEKTN